MKRGARAEYLPEEGEGKEQGHGLPPHSHEAEAALLGCILLEPARFGEALERMLDEAAFHSLRHREIWLAMRGLHLEGKPADPILVQQRLRDHGKLDSCGGAGYVSGLPDGVPSASMLPRYLDEVWNKFLTRQLLKGLVDLGGALQAQGRFDAGLVGQFLQRAEEFRRAAVQKGNARPERLKQVSDFGEKTHALWFGGARGEPGMPMPRELYGETFFRRRGSEVTFLLGEKGNGKTTLLQYEVLHAVAQGALGVIASFETPVEVTIKILTRQLLGVRDLPDNDYGHRQKAKAEAWLQSRFFFFDFLGIGHWQELIEVLDFAGEFLAPKDNGDQKPRMFVSVDSVMRLGIMDDDLAQQGQAAMGFANCANRWGAQINLVNHLNKSEGNAKQRSRGSQQWIDNCHNIASVERNERKGARLDELKQLRESGQLTELQFLKDAEEWRLKFDAKWQLHNQRWPGSRQNGGVALWYDTSGGLQYFKEPGREAVDWLERWTRK